MNTMRGINGYFKELTKQDIDNNVHRNFVGGLWDALGQLQLEFLINSGLQPNHKLLDIGCGCLRGGVHYVIKYLKYSGTDHYLIPLSQRCIRS